MSAEARNTSWRRWREAAFATCTAWLVVQNVGLLGLVAWSRPTDALAASESLARTAATWGGPLLGVFLAVVSALALAAWLVHAPREVARARAQEVADDQ
jgi:hypothetical protein